MRDVDVISREYVEKELKMIKLFYQKDMELQMLKINQR